MSMDITKRMARICLMAAYAKEVVHAEGLKQLRASKTHEPLLKSTRLSAEGAEGESISWTTCTRLDKLINGRVVYVTLVEWSEPESSPEYSWYELKSDIDNCTAIVNLKRKLRDMIKNPQKHISVGY